MKKIPNALFWHFYSDYLKDKRYLKEIDYIAEHMEVDYIIPAFLAGTSLDNPRQLHTALKEMTARAHEKGIKFGIHLEQYKGFYNASVAGGDRPVACDQVQLFPIADPEKAEAIAVPYEITLDETGRGTITHTPKWARRKIAPIDPQLLKVYTFEKTAEGFYQDGSLQEVTDQAVITDYRTDAMTVDLNLGEEFAGKTAFFEVAQYYNSTAVTDAFTYHKKQLDSYSDIPLDAFLMDEYGYMVLNIWDVDTGNEEPFRGRIYSAGMKKYYAETLGLDLDRLIFDNFYAPESDERVRIRAINTYFETLRHFPLQIENQVYDYAKKLYGEDIYMGCHDTFHNCLERDEVWHTACNWWNLPREWAHTDENIGFPVRWGIMLAAKNPLTIDMFYHKDTQPYFDHIVEGAPLHTRDFHHAYGDFYWGNSYTDPDFLQKIRILDRQVARLNDFQRVFPKMDLLVIYGVAAQNNWYPDQSAHSVWDIDGTLHIEDKCDEMWNAGYRLALAPDYAIEDGRITQKKGKICFGGYEFTHCLFLYPKFAKKETYAFLNQAQADGVRIAAVGRADLDFDGNPAALTIPTYGEYDLSILQALGCEKSALPGGCLQQDGSFCFVSHGILTGEQTAIDLTVDGVHYTGSHTGLLAYRAGETAFATPGSRLFSDGSEIALKTE